MLTTAVNSRERVSDAKKKWKGKNITENRWLCEVSSAYGTRLSLFYDFF